MTPPWLSVTRGDAPLVVAIPHTGAHVPPDIEDDLASSWLGIRDTDWWIERLYDFAPQLGATVIRTAISRSAIDVNRDPSGASLYPGQATTDLCPLTTFDGQALYLAGRAPDDAEIARRRALYFEPYHTALEAEIARLRAAHARVVVYDAHSIRSVIPRLFEGPLPNFNIGTNSGAACDPALSAAVDRACDVAPFTRVVDGRFKGGWTTRHYGRPADGVHAIQMELACRGYMDEPVGTPTPRTWPAPYNPFRVAPMRAVLTDVLKACLAFAHA